MIAATSSVLLPCHSLRRLRTAPLLAISSSLFGRRHRWSPEPKTSTGRNLDLAIDAETIAARVSASATRLLRSSEASVRRFLSDGSESFRDLQTSVRVDSARNRVFFSCRQSSLVFVANLVLWSFVAVLAARTVLWLRHGFQSGWRLLGSEVIRRDRSLGGREVVVGRRSRRDNRNTKSFRVSANPLSTVRGYELKTSDNVARTWTVKQEKLPNWWPDPVPPPVISTSKREYQGHIDRLVRAILDYRMSGEDYRYDDIIQLRELCKASGVKASFETANARDSFYRASVDFVLNCCSRAIIPSQKPQVSDEDARQFIAGLADNIGLTSSRAATIVSAAVAARTRSCFLQCWALEVQGKRSEAQEELSKICLIHLAFPPEEHSAEMEMVGNGLKRHLSTEQRKHLFSLYKNVCVADSYRSIMEALSLEHLSSEPEA